MTYGGNIEMAAKMDVFKNASALIFQKLFQSGYQGLDERVWVVSTALTIIGFVSYQLLIASWFDTSKFVQGSAKVALDDILKFSTMFIVRQLLSGQSLSDPEFVREMGLFVGSLVAYDLVLHNIVHKQTERLSDATLALTVRDVTKFGLVFTMINFAKGGEFDKQWMLSTGGFVTGLAVYDVIVSKYTETNF